MKVTLQKSKDRKNKVVLDVEVPQETVKKKFDEVYQKIAQEAKVPGFRPGRAPRHILEQHHGKLAREEVIKALVSESYKAGLESEKVDAVDLPEISELKLDADVLSFRATVEVKPEVVIKQYKGLRLDKKSVTVDPSEIEEYVKQLRAAHKINDDVPEERLARALGYRTKDEFRECLRMQSHLKKENEERGRLERELLRQLRANCSFAVPQSLVDKRLRELQEEAAYQMVHYGIAQEKIEDRLEEFKPKFRADAEEQAKVFLILEAIAKLENITPDDQMIRRAMEFVFAEADWN